MATKGKGPRQGVLEGTLSPRMKRIETLAEGYAEARDERMEAGEREVAARDALVDAMKKADLHSYKRGKFSIALDTIDKVKVRISDEEPEDADEDDDKEAKAS